MPQLRIENVTKTYKVDGSVITAVDDVSFTVERGEFISIVGHSGSGKTTLLSIIGGVLGPASGRVLFGDRDIYTLDSDGLSEYRSGNVGFMFQFASLLPVLTAKENLLLPTLFAEGAGEADKRGLERKALELLGNVGLGDKTDAYPSQLSGGQQRRVAIARAFMNDPEIILADEPTGDLDEETEEEMMGFFLKMNKERNATFIMVTHNTDLAARAKRRMRMTHGVNREL